MDLDDVLARSEEELSRSLDRLNIKPGWAVGDALRAASTGTQSLTNKRKSRNQAFQNLVVGTITERVFLEDHLKPLEAAGFGVVDYHAQGDYRDFGLQRDALELPLNVKTASSMFRIAKETVGLDPEDCIPISSYKALGASERVPALLYVDLVAFTLRERVDAFMDSLEGDLAVGWHLLSWYGGRGSIRAQDQCINTLFDRRGEDLKALAPPATSFRAISARRVLAVLRQDPRRVPGLGIKAAGRGVFKGEVNIHVSVRNETRPWG